MRVKNGLVLILIGFAWFFSAAAFGSELEVVEQDKSAPAAQESVANDAVTAAQKTISPEGTAVSETISQTQEVPSQPSGVTVPANEATLVRSSEVTPTQKKVMPAPPVVSSNVGEPTRYTLGPDDIIQINVRRHTEFSDTYPINSEGKIQYKFIGDIEVQGLSKTELKEKITKILSKFIINPEVDVTIVEYRSKIIYVIGEVGAPGKYFMKADKISLREAVVQAGLPTLSASMRKTQLIRPDKSGRPLEKRVDLYALLYEGKLNLDLDMLPGDVLVVPATIFAKIMRIINPVTQPISATSDVAGRVYTRGVI